MKIKSVDNKRNKLHQFTYSLRWYEESSHQKDYEQLTTCKMIIEISVGVGTVTSITVWASCLPPHTILKSTRHVFESKHA